MLTPFPPCARVTGDPFSPGDRRLQKRGNQDRGRSWYAGAPLLVVTLLGCAFVWWVAGRESAYPPLKYGELMQVLAAGPARSRHRPARQGQATATSAAKSSAPLPSPTAGQRRLRPRRCRFALSRRRAGNRPRSCAACSGDGRHGLPGRRRRSRPSRGVRPGD